MSEIIYDMDKNGPKCFIFWGGNCAVLAVKLVDKTKCTERLPMSI
ncbi:hypothetical protein A1S9_01532 [Escherichia coli KTE50]|nr:hypothetical protein A1S9_01532 [Escherichia coli KTE50]